MPPDWEVGLRGGTRCEWYTAALSSGTAYTITLRQLGDTYTGQGEPGGGASVSCYLRDDEWLRWYTPPLTPGLYRVEVSGGGLGTPLYPGTLRAMPDDLPWHTYDFRRRAPNRPYGGFGPRSMKEER